MRVLLDTHAFRWLNNEPEKCPGNVLDICQNPQTTLLLSLASVWEIQVKYQLGKLPLQVPVRELIETSQFEYGLQLLSIQPRHVYVLENLPDHHRDPFDRLLIAQALSEEIPLVTADRNISRYPLKVVWG
ncbi:MAG: type II toxin-antitoxin system VapC family toxin [Sulfuricella sp.]|nr:type II toxin-antitoxin system VapC family toxin [Sulfuricella sp.]